MSCTTYNVVHPSTVSTTHDSYILLVYTLLTNLSFTFDPLLVKIQLQHTKY